MADDPKRPAVLVIWVTFNLAALLRWRRGKPFRWLRIGWTAEHDDEP